MSIKKEEKKGTQSDILPNGSRYHGGKKRPFLCLPEEKRAIFETKKKGGECISRGDQSKEKGAPLVHRKKGRKSPGSTERGKRR